MDVKKIHNSNINLFKNTNKLNLFTYSKIQNKSLSPLSMDIVSFKAGKRILKKSDFTGVDLAIINKYQINIQKFNSKDDLQKVADDMISRLVEKNYKGRQEETQLQRKAILKDWFDYVLKENDAYSYTHVLLILSAITKKLKANDDTLPPVLNKGVLAGTMTEYESMLNSCPKNVPDFKKLYEKNLKQCIMSSTQKIDDMTGWIVIPSKIKDCKNFDENVEKLKMLSHHNWCTKSFNARPYLEKGDFHIYMQKGEPVLGLRFAGNTLVEVQGQKNDSKIPTIFLDVFLSHVNSDKIELDSDVTNKIRDAKELKNQIEKYRADLIDCIGLRDISDVMKLLEYFGVSVSKAKNNTLVISSYGDKLSCLEELNVDENKIFKYVAEIKGDADFSNSAVTDLGELKSIGRDANFSLSCILNLGKLEKVGRNADFNCSKIKDLGSLERIGGDADFSNSAVTNLGELYEIGGSAKFANSELKSLKNLELIGHNANFEESNIIDMGELFRIGWTAKFADSEIRHLGNLTEIRGDANFEDSIVEDLGCLTYIGGDANFKNSNIKDLGGLYEIRGSADFRGSKVQYLGALECIQGEIKYDSPLETEIKRLMDDDDNDDLDNMYENPFFDFNRLDDFDEEDRYKYW